MEEDKFVIPFGLIPEKILESLKKLSQEELASLLQLGFNVKKDICEKPITSVPGTIPVLIGKSGEDYVSKILEEDYDVENVSKSSHSGDRFVSKRQNGINKDIRKVLVEVKCYSNTVPSKEVYKFHDDLKSNRNVRGGVFISLSSNISKKKGDFILDFVHLDKAVPVIYMCSSSPEMIKLALQIIWYYIDALSLDSEECDLLRAKLNKVYKCVGNLSDILGNLSMNRRLINETRENIDRSLQKLYNNMFCIEMKVSQNIDKIQTIINRMTICDKISGGITGTPDEIIPMIMKSIKKEFPQSHIISYPDLKSMLKKILIQYLRKYESELSFEINKKVTIYTLDKAIISVDFLKTKTNIKLNVSGSESLINIPRNMSYDNGWIAFSIDTSFTKKILPQLEDYFGKITS